jgi:hypothetical protein
MDYIYGPAMDQDAIIASRRKVSVDTSLRVRVCMPLCPSCRLFVSDCVSPLLFLAHLSVSVALAIAFCIILCSNTLVLTRMATLAAE